MVAACVPAANPFTWSNATTSNPFPAVVRDQGGCGSCYAFAATQAMTTAISIQKKVNFTVSPQQVLDCDTYDAGCNGGWPSNVYIFAKAVNLIDIVSYPYGAAKGTTCKTATTGYKVSYYNVTNATCAAILAQVAKSPMAVVIYVGAALASYSSGIFSDSNCSYAVNHAVYLVGVDSCNNWIIQNSWGPKWGLNGFFRMAANNTCSICNYGGMSVTMV